MSNITTCKILTKSDENENEELVIYTEWDDSKAKIFIIRSNQSLLKGEILLEDFNKYAKAFDKTLEAYLHETRSILSGDNDNDDIEFLLKDNKFSWKRKRWCLGQIPVTSDTQVECLRKLTVTLMDEYMKNKKKTVQLKKENTTLTNRCSALEEQIKEMIVLKQQLEITIYKQCLLILNKKKEKIRSLRKIINKDHKDPVFDVTTDESDDDVDFKDKSFDHSSQLNKLNAQKRKVISASNENKINDTVKKKRKSENSEKFEKSKATLISKNDNSTKLKTSNEIINESLTKDIKTSKKNYEPFASTSKELSIDVFKKKSITSSICENKCPKVEIRQKDIEPVASTSKELDSYTHTSTKDTDLNFRKTADLNCNIGEDDETPDLFDSESCKSDGDESECEVQLQFDEEKFDDNEKKECAINENNSEEEMF